jgi:hypothetical protein
MNGASRLRRVEDKDAMRSMTASDRIAGTVTSCDHASCGA